MPAPLAPPATALTGEEWQLIIQGGKLTRAQINAIITFARTSYTTDKLPEGSTNLYFTESRAVAALQSALSDKATHAEVSAAINTLINSAPGTLDTMKEIADAIGDDPNFAATMSAALSQRLRVDQAQNLTAGQKAQGQANLGLGSAATKSTSDFATAADLAGKLNYPAAPSARTVAFGTAYQATDKTKAALISVMVETIYSVTLAGTQTDTVELRIGPDATTVANGTGGTAIATFKTSLTGIAVTIGLANTQRNQLAALIPPNWYFAVRRVAGTTATIQGAFDQAL